MIEWQGELFANMPKIVFTCIFRELMGITSDGRIERRIKDDEEDEDGEEEEDKDVPGPSTSSSIVLKPTIPKLGMEETANTRKRFEQKDRVAGIKLIKKAKVIGVPIKATSNCGSFCNICRNNYFCFYF